MAGRTIHTSDALNHVGYSGDGDDGDGDGDDGQKEFALLEESWRSSILPDSNPKVLGVREIAALAGEPAVTKSGGSQSQEVVSGGEHMIPLDREKLDDPCGLAKASHSSSLAAAAIA